MSNPNAAPASGRILPTLPPGLHPELAEVIYDIRELAKTDEHEQIAQRLADEADRLALSNRDRFVLASYILKEHWMSGWSRGYSEREQKRNFPVGY